MVFNSYMILYEMFLGNQDGNLYITVWRNRTTCLSIRMADKVSKRSEIV